MRAAFSSLQLKVRWWQENSQRRESDWKRNARFARNGKQVKKSAKDRFDVKCGEKCGVLVRSVKEKSVPIASHSAYTCGKVAFCAIFLHYLTAVLERNGCPPHPGSSPCCQWSCPSLSIQADKSEVKLSP
jgi:hypothetical protein